MSDRDDFIEALGAYFVAGFNEGRENRHHDTEEHTASLANRAVMQKYDALATLYYDAVTKFVALRAERRLAQARLAEAERLEQLVRKYPHHPCGAVLREWLDTKQPADSAPAVTEEVVSLRDIDNLSGGCYRPCTCHPDDNPPRPCPQKYALSECRAASEPAAPKFDKVWCSQCGGEFGPRDSGYSHCADHSADPVIHAQHDETGRMWTGPRSQLPRRYFECVTDEAYEAQVATSTVSVHQETK